MPNQKENYVRVHPEFRAIFTSNPQEYSGVHDAQDALSDRMVTIDVDYFDRDTELGVTISRSGLARPKAERIVDLVREYRASGEYDQMPTLRASIMIARVVAQQNLQTSSSDPRFVQTCLDLLGGRAAFRSRSADERLQQRKMLMSLIQHHCPPVGIQHTVTDKRPTPKIAAKLTPKRSRNGHMPAEVQ